MVISTEKKYNITDFPSACICHNGPATYLSVHFCEPQVKPGMETLLSEFSSIYSINDIFDILNCKKYICIDPGKLSINSYSLIPYDTFIFYQSRRYEFKACTGSRSLSEFFHISPAYSDTNVQNEIRRLFMEDLEIPVRLYPDEESFFTVPESSLPLMHIAEANDNLKKLIRLAQPDCIINPARVRLHKLLSTI